MSPPTAVTESMQRITTTKLVTLAAHHATFERTKSQILQEVDKEASPSQRVRILLDRLEEHKLRMPHSFDVDTMRAFLEQSKHDPSVSLSLLDSWEEKLRGSLNVPSRKYEHAALFGRLATEWLESGTTASTAASSQSDQEMDDSFEPVGRKEMHEQRKEWEQLVFNPRAEPDTGLIEKYLKDLFDSTPESQSALKTMRERAEDFELQRVFPGDVKATINNLITADLLNYEKQAALKDLRGNDLVLTEIADVLNMQLDSLASWSWGEEPVPLELRRALNGKYRVYMDEDLLTAILLEYIGGKWAVFLKECFTGFMVTAWKKPSKPQDQIGAYRVNRNRKPRPGASAYGVEATRWETYRKEYFMQHLPDDFKAGQSGYGDSDTIQDDDSIQGGYSKRSRTPKKKSFATKKQELFHLIATESLITSRLNGSWTILQSDFRWFGPSLPHATILTVVKFFDVPKEWLDFFQKYLTPPLKFVQDGPNGNTITRKSGVPISHILTDVMGEAILFCLDFAVNHHAKSNLYRVHDDIWFWGSKESTALAWTTLKDFTKVMGLELNLDKTGSAEIVDPAAKTTVTKSSSNTLPPAPVKWGFLTLDSSGHWQMNSKKVQEHIAELRIQLAATTSILAWIQAWNTYVARFLSANFGEPANCLGKAHVDMVIQTFKHIQESLFSASGSTEGEPRNVTDYLKSQLRSRFNIKSDIPDGLLYFPLELGGLGLLSPLIPLMLVHKEAPDNPADTIAIALQANEIRYNHLRDEFDSGNDDAVIRSLTDSNGDFISLKDYQSHAESASENLGSAYAELMKKPESLSVAYSTDIRAAVQAEKSEDNRETNGRFFVWDEDAYWRWIFQLYGGVIVREFGGLAMGEKKLLPIGLVRMLREMRVRWQG